MAEAVGELALGAIGVTAAEAGAVIGISAAAAAAGVGSVILIGGAIGLQLLINKPPVGSAQQPGDPALPPPEAGHQPLNQTIPPRIVGLGRVRVAGAYVLFEANAGISYDVIAFHHGVIGSIIGYYLHDDVVVIDPLTGVVDVQGDGRYGSSAITIKTRTGLTPETAYSEISTPLSTAWGADYRGDGLASLALICNQLATPSDFANTFPRGLPKPSVVVDCTAILDPRTSTTAVSTNPVLQIIWYLTDADRGMGFDYATLITPNLTALMAQANICDAQIARNDGSFEPRYTSNGSFSLDSEHAAVVSSILDTCDGWISQNGDGSLSLVVGRYITPTITLHSKHIRACILQYDVAEEEAVNELTIDYTEPLADYKTQPGQPWRNEDDISVRGRTLSQRMALPWVYSHAQARRLAKRQDAKNNASLRGTLTTTLYGIRCLGERWVQVIAPDLPDLEDLVIEVRGMTVDLLNASCSLKFVSIDPDTIDAWNPATEEGSAPTIPGKLVTIAPPVPQNVSASNSVPRPTLPFKFVVIFDNPGRGDLRYQAQYRINGSSGSFTQESITDAKTDPAIPGQLYIDAGDFHTVISGQFYEVQIRSFGPTGPGSSFSSSATVLITF